MRKTTTVNFKGIPKTLYKHFKAVCAEQDITATQGFIELMRQATGELLEPLEPPEEAEHTAN
mgnify:FL=1